MLLEVRVLESGWHHKIWQRCVSRSSRTLAADGCLTLPLQDCSRSYSAALRFSRLNERDAVCSHRCDQRLTGDLVSASQGEGLHTLSQCGPLTLLDVKRISRDRGRQWLAQQRRWKRLRQRIADRGPGTRHGRRPMPS